MLPTGRVRFLVSLVAVVLLGYVAVMLAQSYFDVAAAVEEAGQYAVRQQPVLAASRGNVRIGEMAAKAFAEALSRRGRSIDTRRFTAHTEGNQLIVAITWPHPVIKLAGEPVLVLPLTIERSYSLDVL